MHFLSVLKVTVTLEYRVNFGFREIKPCIQYFRSDVAPIKNYHWFSLWSVIPSAPRRAGIAMPSTALLLTLRGSVLCRYLQSVFAKKKIELIVTGKRRFYGQSLACSHCCPAGKSGWAHPRNFGHLHPLGRCLGRVCWPWRGTRHLILFLWPLLAYYSSTAWFPGEGFVYLKFKACITPYEIVIFSR